MLFMLLNIILALCKIVYLYLCYIVVYKPFKTKKLIHGGQEH